MLGETVADDTDITDELDDENPEANTGDPVTFDLGDPDGDK